MEKCSFCDDQHEYKCEHIVTYGKAIRKENYYMCKKHYQEKRLEIDIAAARGTREIRPNGHIETKWYRVKQKMRDVNESNS